MFFSAGLREWSWKENANQEKRFAHSVKEKVEVEFDESADAKGWRVYNIYRDCIRKLRQHLRARGLPQRIPMGPNPQGRDGERIRHRQGWQQIRTSSRTKVKDTAATGGWKAGSGTDEHRKVVWYNSANNGLSLTYLYPENFNISNFEYLLLFICEFVEIVKLWKAFLKK